MYIRMQYNVAIHKFVIPKTTVIIDMAAFEIDDDVTFSANEFDEINKEETKKNLLNSAVLGILTRFSSGFRVC